MRQYDYCDNRLSRLTDIIYSFKSVLRDLDEHEDKDAFEVVEEYIVKYQDEYNDLLKRFEELEDKVPIDWR